MEILFFQRTSPEVGIWGLVSSLNSTVLLFPPFFQLPSGCQDDSAVSGRCRCRNSIIRRKKHPLQRTSFGKKPSLNTTTTPKVDFISQNFTFGSSLNQSLAREAGYPSLAEKSKCMPMCRRVVRCLHSRLCQ